MEISPLPHKPAFSHAHPIELQSPTPEPTPADTPMVCIEEAPSSPALSSPVPTAFEAPRPIHPHELVARCLDTQDANTDLQPSRRRRASLLRPSVNRMKGYSTNAIPQKLDGQENKLPPFRFGNGCTKMKSSSSMSLSECFAESPPQDRVMPLQDRPFSRNSSFNVMGPPRPKQPFPAFSGGRNNGSPISNHVRKPTNPLVRPRKAFRRSLSMFEHPEDVMKQETCSREPAQLGAILDEDSSPPLQLPHFTTTQPDSLPRITKDTMIDVLDGKYDSHYGKRVVIDCRFEYEYSGGHIDGAVNYCDRDRLVADLFGLESLSNVLLIFHCEYSAHRAPIM